MVLQCAGVLGILFAEWAAVCGEPWVGVVAAVRGGGPGLDLGGRPGRAGAGQFPTHGRSPLVAATRGPRGTAVSVAVCLGLQMLMAWRRPGHFDEQHHVALYGATFLIGVVSVLLSVQRERAQRHLIRANSVAEALQRTLLRPVPPRIRHVRAAAYYTAGEGGTLVGGDLYDVCETPFGVRAIIGDVRGKGVNAVQAVAAVLGVSGCPRMNGKISPSWRTGWN